MGFTKMHSLTKFKVKAINRSNWDFASGNGIQKHKVGQRKSGFLDRIEAQSKYNSNDSFALLRLALVTGGLVLNSRPIQPRNRE